MVIALTRTSSSAVDGVAPADSGQFSLLTLFLLVLQFLDIFRLISLIIYRTCELAENADGKGSEDPLSHKQGVCCCLKGCLLRLCAPSILFGVRVLEFARYRIGNRVREIFNR